ncbi:S9 family peptidase [Nitrospirillum viridazoti]|uniref:S9 family peptidase n=1 Tax=Nitrospirillum viridazoti CBAmc TaxID=1441467 RepID=A0A248JN78_9PROT|nr:S9 family peptidase [Nitrospirillum amazonense]ASG20167.1 S9 family peptidase [Nitrospirillum amazonense CBAmc]TWB29555.1 dipeptidyl aminopeptidase/acylaminoacyl peptidase [Nitrospirillum amazonense]
MRAAVLALTVILGTTSLTAAAPPPPATSPAAPLIERAKFFGNPSRTQGKLSPDGKWLSWIAPRDGVLNIWVAPASDPTKAKALTAEKTRPIRQHFWSPDGKMILFVNDKGGDENFVLYGVNVATGEQRTLTPQEKTRVDIIGTSHHIKDRILVGLNNRDPKWFDVYSLDLAKGKLTLVFKNEGYAGFVADESLKLRLAAKSRPDGGTDFFRVADNKVEAQPLGAVGLDDSLTTNPLGYTEDGKTLYWIDSRGRDTAALIAQDAATGATRVVGQSDKADVGDILADPKTGVVQAYGVDYLRTEWTALDPKIGAELDFLKTQLKGDIHVTSRTDDDGAWTVVVDPVTAPAATYRFDRKAHTLTKLFVNRPELEGADLAAMHPVEIKARDGLTLVSYLTLPAGADGKGDGHPDQPLPMVLFVHGGPWARDGYGYNGYHQWLANRGYAVLSVNYRGSTGFGKNFITAGNLQWGRKMHDDLIDAVDWAVKQGITTKDKVAIMGGSYGGYATLAGLTFTPDAFACGVDIVGPSNLATLLKTIPPYWEAGKQQFYKRMGDPTTEDGRQLLHDASPLFKAADIKKPLLIGQGANDPRVNQAESDQIVKAMKEKNIPVTYILFPDEGHGFARPENSIAFNAAAEQFLGACLGGRAEPFGAAFKGSSITVPDGAQFTPGLQAALAAK